MTAAEFPRRWLAPGSLLWRSAKPETYTELPYASLPVLPIASPSAPFAWLRESPVRRDGLTMDADGDAERLLEDLVTSAKAEGLTLPPTYLLFMSDVSLHSRVPSCTACYLDVPTKLIPVPDGRPGRLLRFLNDQQCCALWYLHLSPDGGCSVVYATPEFDDDGNDGDTLDDAAQLHDIATCSSSFEEFIHRFWLENTLWYALFSEKRSEYLPLSAEQQAYLDAVQLAQQSS